MTKAALKLWDRKLQRVVMEQIYGEGFLRAAYLNKIGRALTDHVFARRAPSFLAGLWYSSRMSRAMIPGFIQSFAIDMREFESGPFKSFNDFFVRRFKPEARQWTQAPDALAAFAEGRYLGFDSVASHGELPVKGACLRVPDLLGEGPEKLAARQSDRFLGGPALVARLCPLDYHRFHFPADGRVLAQYRINGEFHSVHPWALLHRPDVFLRNERQVTILDTPSFGRLAYIEVGALNVGRIVQTYAGHSQSGSGAGFKRGEEKGYFLFGASTVIVLGEPGRWYVDEDILARTRQGQECLVRLGERVAALTASA